MLLSAVSVLVVAQSSSKIPEGLMNNPVYYKILLKKLTVAQLSRRFLPFTETTIPIPSIRRAVFPFTSGTAFCRRTGLAHLMKTLSMDKAGRWN